ncbi:11859_t:CDS:1 [Acaulospora colombiana]|uniref:11859_t:CDS:1 n=1 Tax=Acaulospora colombiana TaxID=27376 RepID=A0ACA9LVZ4_9GLOM|nr:11859_t:CDS:1 [Acaulospora colombiana]
MTSESPSIQDYLPKWEEICTEFFDNNDENLEAVIRLVEFATRSDGKVTLNFTMIDKRLRIEEIETLLIKIGFVNGVMLHPQEFDKYLETKRKVRTEWHRRKAIELFKELDELLLSKPFIYTPAHRLSEFKTYVTQYHNSIGAQPFIRGLQQVFQLQSGQFTIASWTFLDDILTQNGPDFMRSTVNLLVNVLAFTHTIQEVDEGGDRGSLRTWYVNVELSDGEINSLLKVFPKNKKALGSVRATGSAELSSQQRSPNLIGTFDGNILGKLCWLPIRIMFFWWFVPKSLISFCLHTILSKRKKAGPNI